MPEESASAPGQEPGAGDLLSRFPSLAELGRLRRREIPFVRQLSSDECGVACVAMVLGYHGRPTSLEELRELVGVERGGASAQALLEAAEYFGLQGQGVSLDLDQLHLLEPGTILHWSFNHFVVFERLLPRDAGVEVIDPSAGRRRVSMEEFSKCFTGVALLLEPVYTFRTASGPAHPLWAYLQQILVHARPLTPLLLTSTLLLVFGLAAPLLTGAVIDQVVPHGDVELLALLCIAMGGMVGFHFLAALIRSRLLLHLRIRLDISMALGFLGRLVRLPFAFFQSRPVGDLLSRLTSHEQVRELLSNGLLSLALDGTFALLYLVLLVILAPALALATLGLGLVNLVLFASTARRRRELVSQELQLNARSASYAVEVLSGIETIKALGLESSAERKYMGLFTEVLNAGLARGRLSGALEAAYGALRLASPLVVLALGAHQVLAGRMTLGGMLALNALAQGFLTPLGSLMQTGMQLQSIAGFVERIEDIYRAEPEQLLGEQRLRHEVKGRIDLSHVSFRYGPRSHEVVRDVSLAVEPGQFVALVGPSGSGKSTLASLMLGLHRPTTGHVCFDGLDLSQMDLPHVRRQLGIVTQQPYLFNQSIRFNIAGGNESLPLDAVIDAAKCARAHDDIEAMPLGYETLLSEGGGGVSGGQRQRIALARALSRRPSILLLDEATSALDALTEKAVQLELAALRCTRVVIAHRLSTIADADLILVMDRGRIIERGTHQELLALRGAYAHLVAGQLKTGIDAAAAIDGRDERGGAPTLSAPASSRGPTPP